MDRVRWHRALSETEKIILLVGVVMMWMDPSGMSWGGEPMLNLRIGRKVIPF